MIPLLDFTELKQARDYREFLQKYLKTRRISQAALARAGGFTRGFPTEIMMGRRRLTSKSCHAFEKALKLPRPAKKLFRLLVARDEQDVFPDIDRSKLDRQIQELREKSWERFHKVDEASAPRSSGAFDDPRLMTVYAACGQPGAGATFEEIVRRSALGTGSASDALAKLQKLGLVHPKGDRFEPQSAHFFLEGDDERRTLIDAVQRAARKVSERIEVAANSDTEMFMVSSFSVSKDRMPELKAKWKELVLQFIDDSIQPDGENVVNLIAALHL